MNDYISGWNDWTEALADWHDVSISELHGFVTGILTVCDAPKAEVWQTLLTELSFSELEQNALQLVSTEAEDIVALLVDEQDSYQFTPLLPDDEHPLYERLIALKDWSNGFLTGFGMTGSALRIEEQPLFNDLAKIGALRIDEHDEALQSNDNPEGEANYMELVEFVRMIPVSVSTGRVRKLVEKLPMIAGFAMNMPVGQNQHQQSEMISDFDEEQAWQAEKEANDAFLANMVIDAMNSNKPS